MVLLTSLPDLCGVFFMHFVLAEHNRGLAGLELSVQLVVLTKKINNID